MIGYFTYAMIVLRKT
jgi:hypothetical protein